MTHWNSAVCETNGIRLHYTRTGGNKPPLILLHGLMTNGLCWTGLAQALEDEYDVIMPDARGHGLSSAPNEGYRYEDHANDLVGLMQALGLSSPFLLGHSMGGMTAAVVASRNPSLLRGLVLAEPTFLSPAVQRQVWESDVADQHRQQLAKPLAEVVADAQVRHPHRSPQVLELVARARLQTRMEAFAVLMPPNPDYQQLVREIAVPTLLIRAETGVISAEVAEEVLHLNTAFQAERLPEAGHALHLDQPDRFAAVVKGFLGAIGGGESRGR